MNKVEKRMMSQRMTAVVGMTLILLVLVVFFISRQNNTNANSQKQTDSTSQVNKVNTTQTSTSNTTKNESTKTDTATKPITTTPTIPELPVDQFTSIVKNLYTWDGTRSAKTFQIFDCSNGPEGMFATPKLSLTGYQIQTINMNGLEYAPYKVKDFLTFQGWVQDECNTADMPGHIYVMNKDGKNALVEEVTGDGDSSWKVRITYEL